MSILSLYTFARRQVIGFLSEVALRINPSLARRGVVLALVLAAASTGCNRAGPAAVKSLAGTGSGAARAAGKAGQGPARTGWRDRAGNVAREHAGDVIQPAADWLRSQATQGGGEPAPERFPVGLLTADPATREFSPDGRFCFMQNNYYGVNGYDAATGRLVSFSALHRATGQMQYFDAAGNRTK